MRADESEPRLKDDAAFADGSQAFLSLVSTVEPGSMISGSTTLAFVVVVVLTVVVVVVLAVVAKVVVVDVVVVVTSFSLLTLQRALASPSND